MFRRSFFIFPRASLLLLELCRPNAKFVFLVRDVRDVAVSSRRSVFNPFHPLLTAQLWSKQQSLGLELLARHPASTLLLTYESLLASPVASVRRLCEFLGERYEPGMMRYFETDEATKGAELMDSWSNTATPLLQNNSRKWDKKNGLARLDLEKVEGAAHEAMLSLGYVPETPPERLEVVKGGLQHWSQQVWLEAHAQDWWLWLLVESRSLAHDANHWRRWLRYWTVFAVRQTRRITASRNEL